MEDYRSWDLLTASISVAPSAEPLLSWAFLVVQGLVRDQKGDRELFVKIQAEESAKMITGPSVSARIAGQLTRQGMTLPPSRRSDPEGKIAKSRFDLLSQWRSGL